MFLRVETTCQNNIAESGETGKYRESQPKQIYLEVVGIGWNILLILGIADW